MGIMPRLLHTHWYQKNCFLPDSIFLFQNALGTFCKSSFVLKETREYFAELAEQTLL